MLIQADGAGLSASPLAAAPPGAAAAALAAAAAGQALAPVDKPLAARAQFGPK
jgi:hypothetical protein